MRHVMYILFFVVNSIISMHNDDDLHKQLERIIREGTLAEFETYEPVFRKKLEANTILVAQQFWCDPRLAAIKEVQTMQAHPAIKQLVLTMQQEIKALKLSSPKEEFYKKRDLYLREAALSVEKDTSEKAINIVKCLMLGDVSQVGFSIRAITAQLEQESDQEGYLAHEQDKLDTIEKRLKQILDDEFEPQPELQYDKDYDLFFFKQRERKER